VHMGRTVDPGFFGARTCLRHERKERREHQFYQHVHKRPAGSDLGPTNHATRLTWQKGKMRWLADESVNPYLDAPETEKVDHTPKNEGNADMKA